MNLTLSRRLALLTLVAGSALLAGCATPGAPAEVRSALAPTGTLRIGVYPGSPTSLVRGPGADEMRGVTVDIGREMARRLGVPAEIVVFERVPEIVDALKAGRADVTITNATPARARDLDFTPAVVGLETGYLVPANSPIQAFAEVDRAGVRVGVTQGSTSQGTLGRELKQAKVVPAASVTAATEMLRRGELDAFATNKGILFEMADKLPGARVLDGRWGLEQLAIGVPKGREAATAWLKTFAAEVSDQGLVQQAAARAGLRGTVAPPGPEEALAMWDVLVIGGGNAALCAALTAREAGASVLLLESAPRAWRGGNSVHTRNIRCSHDAPQDVLTDAYPEEEFWQDLLKVTGGKTREALTRRVIRDSATCRGWMRRHGVHFQPSLSGTLHLSRTNAFFMGGGKALVNAYYRSAEALGVAVRYDTPVARIELQGDRFAAAHTAQGERIAAKVCVVASGGFESNREWLREAWGRNARGEWPADQFAIRGTRFNLGVLLKDLLAQGADAIGDATQAHMVAIDARAPLYDGGICTRVDCVSLGIMVNRDGQRFYDEGEDFWPKRYAIWGRLVAHQPGQVGHCVIDAKAVGRFMPPVFRGVQADTLPELARQLGLSGDSEAAFLKTVADYNAACRVGTFDHAVLDDCHTEGLSPAKTHWARPIDTAPFYGYTLKPGITFTYLGLWVDDDAAVHFGGKPSANLFAAGEVMAGNVLGQGYTAGVGMTIGTVFGRIAGASAARAVKAAAVAATASEGVELAGA